ncbi:LysR family transcriptional regulator [Martelella endophytica]|uniref:LysR family transcriptional regulator n=1 Tax=Martelella endophytica TaxID=1486262 RepID=UPI0006964479|nr:LysR family transcriptional regulator [Martelella endophytica]
MANLPPLSSLLAFEAVYRTGSVTDAARMLGRTHGAVSKQLKQLHEHSGVDLFEKHGSGLMLTDHGRAFARTVAAALDDIRGGYDTLVASCCRQPVKLLASATFARTWLIPVLSRFSTAFSDIEIALQLVGPGGSRDYEGVSDLSFSYNRLLSPEMLDGAVSLGDIAMGPVLAPDYPHRLEAGTLSFATRIDRRRTETMWQTWSQLSGIAVKTQKELVFDHTYLGFQAARTGMGAVMAPSFLVRSMLESGELIAPAGFVTFEDGFIVRPTWPRDRAPNPDALTLLDWLKDNARLEA